MAYLTLLAGLMISAVSMYYSVTGLASIFSAAFIPIVIMGTALELAKLVATVWLKQNWNTAPKLLKSYLLGAVVVLMLITSLGCFGYLSRAHSDQQLVSGEVQTKLAMLDEKIAMERANIDDAKRGITQMNSIIDEAVASTDGYGANRANRIRTAQLKEREVLALKIQQSQDNIVKLNAEREPYAAQNRKVESEVGPIKYIAAFVYGDNPSVNMLEKAVTWMIILLIVVFDPLAVMLLLASQHSFEQRRKQLNQLKPHVPDTQGIDSKTVVQTVRPATEDTTSHGTMAPAEPHLAHSTPDVNDDSDSVDKSGDITESKSVEQISKSYTDVLPDVSEPKYKIPSSDPEFIHTREGTIVRYADGKEEFIKIEPDSGTYVQNEEQSNSSKWSSLLMSKQITEDAYHQAVKKKT